MANAGKMGDFDGELLGVVRVDFFSVVALPCSGLSTMCGKRQSAAEICPRREAVGEKRPSSLNLAFRVGETLPFQEMPDLRADDELMGSLQADEE